MQNPPLKIKKLDVLGVYPKGQNYQPNFYFGKKWAVVAYELTGEIKGVIDIPLPRDTDDVHPVAIEAITREIRRGVFGTAEPDKVEPAYRPGFAVAA